LPEAGETSGVQLRLFLKRRRWIVNASGGEWFWMQQLFFLQLRYLWLNRIVQCLKATTTHDNQPSS
jgi:hypothetical protein